MISPELLKRYPFFAGMTQAQLETLAMVAEEASFEKGATIFEECDQANRLFLLLEGGVDLFYRAEGEYNPPVVKQFSVGEINPGEVFGTSALVEPYELNATAKAAKRCRVITLDAHELRKLLEKDPELNAKFLLQVVKILKERIISLRVQMAASQP